MKLNEIYPSKYLRAEDLNGKELQVEIEKVVMETFPGEDRPKPVLMFKSHSKGLVLNVTNARAIAKHYGSETDDWTGKPIVLFPCDVAFRGETVEAVRVRVPKSKTTTPQPQATEELHDEIPF